MTYNAFSSGLGDHCIITMLFAGSQERLRPGRMQPGRFDSAPLLKARVAALMDVLLLAVPAWAADFAVIGDTRPRFDSGSLQPFESLIAKINGLKPALLVNFELSCA